MTVAVRFLDLNARFLHTQEQYIAVLILATNGVSQQAHSFSIRAV